MSLNIKAFSLTCGLLWGFGLFFITWWIILLEGITGEITLIGKVYLGYSISPVGSIIGLLWGLVDGIIAGALLAWLYNKLSQKMAS